ncbi:MAG: GNAT family N-acetyltransferase [Planctomycetota bacterium]
MNETQPGPALASPDVTRCAVASDRPAQAALFDRCFGRGDGGEVLPWRYDAGPHGASLARVVPREGSPTSAEDADMALVASYACSPRIVVTREGPVTVGQTGDVMTLPSQRGKGLFSALDRAVMEDARAAGWPVVFGLPNSASAHIFTRDLGWLEVGRVRPWTFVLAADAGARAERLRVSRLAAALVPWAYWRGTMRVGHMKDQFFAKANVVAIARFKPEVDAVTAEAAAQGAWTIQRDHRYLNWRFCDAPSGRFKAHGVYEPSGKMRGYAVVQLPARGDAVGYIADVVALDRVAFAAAMEAGLSHLRKAGASVARAYAFDGSRWQADLVWSGFRAPKAADSKAVIARVLDERHPIAAVARDAARWSFTDADRDAELIT